MHRTSPAADVKLNVMIDPLYLLSKAADNFRVFLFISQLNII
jgi:hypothetical protein